MNTKILTILVLLLIATGTIARQCYECNVCPKPFKGNEEAVRKVDVGDDEYCFKTIVPITGFINRGNGGSNCKPTDQVNFCCQGNLCNGATTGTLSVKLLAATASLFFAMRFFY